MSHFRIKLGVIIVLEILQFFHKVITVTEDPDFTLLDEEVAKRVNDLINTGNYNLSYFTNFEYVNRTLFDRTLKNGVIVSDDTRCSRVGAYYLQRGGNVYDGAVAASLCHSVIELASTGLSGGGLALMYVNGKFRALDFRAKTSETFFTSVNFPSGVVRAFKIPGFVKGLYELWKLGGKIEWQTLFDIPIMIALKGWEIKPSLYRMLWLKRKRLIHDPFLKSILFNDTTVKTNREHIINKPLARTLHLISKNYSSMYFGSIPSIMMKHINISEPEKIIAEIGNYTTKKLDLLNLQLEGSKYMVTTSKNTGGPLVAYIINAVKGYAQANPELFQHGYHMKATYYMTLFNIITDAEKNSPNFMTDERIEIIKNAYYQYTNQTNNVTKKSKLARNYKSPPPVENDEAFKDEFHGTVSLNVLDDCGNGISMVTEIDQLFGGGYAFPSLGIIGNTYTNVQMDENSSIIEPTIKIQQTYDSPVIVIDKTDNNIYGMFSGTGGHKIAPAVAQVMINHYYRHMNLGSALTVFRMFNHYLYPGLYSEGVMQIHKYVYEYILLRKDIPYKYIRVPYLSSVSAVSITRNERGNPDSIFAMGDYRRNGGTSGY